MSALPDGFTSMTRLASGAIVLVRSDGARVIASTDAHGVLWVSVQKAGEATHRSVHEPERPGARTSEHKADDGCVRSPTGGVLRSLAVSLGDVVEEGAVLGHVEAMKMQLELRAGSGGIVRAIDARVGDRVERGASLLRITP